MYLKSERSPYVRSDSNRSWIIMTFTRLFVQLFLLFLEFDRADNTTSLACNMRCQTSTSLLRTFAIGLLTQQPCPSLTLASSIFSRYLVFRILIIISPQSHTYEQLRSNAVSSPRPSTPRASGPAIEFSANAYADLPSLPIIPDVSLR